MAEVVLTVTNPVGLHARPAALFVQTAARFPHTTIRVVKDGKPADAKSILQVLTLGVGPGASITIQAEGEQAMDALAALTELVRSDFEGL